MIQISKQNLKSIMAISCLICILLIDIQQIHAQQIPFLNNPDPKNIQQYTTKIQEYTNKIKEYD